MSLESDIQTAIGSITAPDRRSSRAGLQINSQGSGASIYYRPNGMILEAVLEGLYRQWGKALDNVLKEYEVRVFKDGVVITPRK